MGAQRTEPGPAPKKPAQRSTRRSPRPPHVRAADLAAELGLPLVLRRKASLRWAAVGACLGVAALLAAFAAWAWSMGDARGAGLCGGLAALFVAGAALAWRWMSIVVTVREDGLSWRGLGIRRDLRYRELDSVVEVGFGVFRFRAWGRWHTLVADAGPEVSMRALSQFFDAQVKAAQRPLPPSGDAP